MDPEDWKSPTHWPILVANSSVSWPLSLFSRNKVSTCLFNFFLGETNSSFLFLCLLWNILQPKAPSVKLEAKIYLWRKSGEWEKTSGLVSCLLSCFPCCFSSCLLLFFKHSNWSVLSGIFQKPMLTGCSLAKFTYQTKTNTLENIFFKTIFPFTKPVPFQHQYQTKTLWEFASWTFYSVLSAPTELWPWPKFC